MNAAQQKRRPQGAKEVTRRSLRPAEFTDIARAALARGVRVRFVATGGSMVPAMRAGTAVELTPPGELTRGDLVCAIDAYSRLVVHRVSAVGPDWVETWGDAAASGDGRFPASEVIGRIRPLGPARPTTLLARAAWAVSARLPHAAGAALESAMRRSLSSLAGNTSLTQPAGAVHFTEIV